MTIIDSHCHLNYEPLVNNVDVINRASKIGATHMLTFYKDKNFLPYLKY